MATQPPPNLPVMYNDLRPLSSNEHGAYHSRPSDKAPFFARIHAVPLTIDEFIHAQRHTPIVFSSGENSVPLALFGLNEGVNTFVDEEGKPHNPFYVPAYVRRYPYLLARLRPEVDELSLCFDPTTDLVGAFDEGQALFDDEKPSEHLNNVLKFCEDFELAGQRTTAFMNELKGLDLLIDGEVSIQPEGSDQPFVYRGFQMVSEEKFRELHGDQLRKINQNGILALIVAHLFSLSLVRDIFARQMSQGKVPGAPELTPVNA
ncbi:SapC family protein [Sphingosinicella sp. LHD-64]|uniref:SapC family protein n=1 Tax=Sphingosinicella sp. LHD-64 TaxID=3072139 RepID=UPI00280FB7A3|nr:SapC family protein [Sphingosinicella sp. LHD-64]MDQ8755924.1 SapC family protein [Sphingosinicella sp. LHD-64]